MALVRLIYLGFLGKLLPPYLYVYIYIYIYIKIPELGSSVDYYFVYVFFRKGVPTNY